MDTVFQKSIPIYLQVVDRMKRRIINGELKIGEKLPSVREIAIQFEINPNTVQRAYAEMERMGILETRRGHGSFVTDDRDKLKQIREELKQQQIHDFVQQMKEAGFSSSDIISGVSDYLMKMAKGEDQ